MTSTLTSPGRSTEPKPRAFAAGGSFLPRPRFDQVTVSSILIILTTLAIISYNNLGISLSGMVQSWPNALNFFRRAVPLDFPPAGEILWQTGVTLGIVICGTLLAAVLSLPIAYIAASNTSPHESLRWVGRALGVIARSMPDAILAMIFAMILSGGALPGILALGIHSIGMISKLFADSIEQIDEGPRLAIRAAGGTKSQEFWGAIFPQILPSVVSIVLLRNDINIRVSVILGFVGVYGLGYQISFAMQTLDYRRAMALAVVMFVLCLVMEIISSAIRTNLLGIQPTGRGIGDRLQRVLSRRQVPAVTTPPLTEAQRAEERAIALAIALASPDPTTAKPSRRRPWTRARVQATAFAWGAVIVVIAAISVSATQLSPVVDFWGNLTIQMNRMFPPGFSETGAQKIIPALVETVQIALAATLISVVVSLVLGSFAARNVAPHPAVRGISRFILVAIRGIPELLLALVLIVITGLGPIAATLALGLAGIGVLGKLMGDSIEEGNPGPERALKATGATRTQIFAGATLPQSAPAFVSSIFYMLDSNIRAATILGIVGGGGVGFMLTQSTTINQQQMLAILLSILVVVLIVESLAMTVRKLMR